MRAMEVGTFVMAGLVPAIHVFTCVNKARRGCPAPVYAKASTGSVSVRRSFSEGGHKAGHDESRDIVDRIMHTEPAEHRLPVGVPPRVALFEWREFPPPASHHSMRCDLPRKRER